MKETLKLVAVLTIICALSAALLATVYNKTMEPILVALDAKTVNAAREVMPEGSSDINKVVIGETDFFVARAENGEIEAVALEGISNNGYGGKLSLMIGVSRDKKVVDYKVIVSNETPGCGTKISGEKFKAPLREKLFSSNWKVRQDDGDFDAITGATISSRAAFECINDAISKYEQNLAQLQLNQGSHAAK